MMLTCFGGTIHTESFDLFALSIVILSAKLIQLRYQILVIPRSLKFMPTRHFFQNY